MRRDPQNKKGNSRGICLGHCKDTEKTGLEVGSRRSHGPQSLADHHVGLRWTLQSHQEV